MQCLGESLLKFTLVVPSLIASCTQNYIGVGSFVPKRRKGCVYLFYSYDEIWEIIPEINWNLFFSLFNSVLKDKSNASRSISVSQTIWHDWKIKMKNWFWEKWRSMKKGSHILNKILENLSFSTKKKLY